MRSKRAQREIDGSINKSVDRLWKLVKSCKYWGDSVNEEDRSIRDRFVAGCRQTKIEMEVRRPNGANRKGGTHQFSDHFELVNIFEREVKEICLKVANMFES